MSKIAIRAENLGKCYAVGHKSSEIGNYNSLRDVLSSNVNILLRNTRDMWSGKPLVFGDSIEQFWAIKDISFEIKQGERVGIIGRNGAGKSTLLKVLSRIIQPTNGRAIIDGRIASLLEVGTGFHPELTGRENIYLNGAILGMTRKEVKNKFDEIVEFAEVEKFIDTPVKKYSSGMYVRLAFSVAAYLEPETLIVDEVLAVGDSRFQKKCVSRMRDVGNDGRTIILVSHNMGTISEFCDRCLLLEEGKLVADGLPRNIIEQYIGSGNDSNVVSIQSDLNKPVFVTSLKIMDEKGRTADRICLGNDAILEIQYTISRKLANVNMAILISRNGNNILYSHDNDLTPTFNSEQREPGNYSAILHLPLSKFKEGNYSIEVHIGVGADNISDKNANIMLDIENYELNTVDKGYRVDRPGHFYFPIEWQTKKIEN